MQRIYGLLLFLCTASSLSAQTVESPLPKRKKCYTTEYLAIQRKLHPGSETPAQFESWMTEKILQKRSTPSLNDIKNYGPLPVVFHIIHTGQTEGNGYNISSALVYAQYLQLNKDFSNQSGSIYSVASNTGLQFCLAAKDPSGNPLAQPGIDRVSAVGKTFGQPPYSEANFDNKVKAVTFWDPTKYINIWITEFTEDEGILGYATFPASSTLQGLDNTETNATAGVVIDYRTVGSIGTPSSACGSSNVYNTGKTLVHEMGHYFGLRHIWGDGDCATDYCDDTPVHTTANFGAPTHPKPNSCGTADEMFENFMDYTDDYLLNTFTINQAERMQVVILNSARRKQLPTSTAGCGAPVLASKIGFTPCTGTMTVSERSTMITCPQYTDVQLYLNIEDKAAGSATLTLTTSGTAIKDVDYQLMTPSLTIAAGENHKIVTVRIFDDGIKEAQESIIVSYTISGSGVTQNASLPSSFTILVNDDDNFLISNNSKTLFSENFDNSGSAIPTGWTLRTVDISNPRNKWVVSSNPGTGTTGQALHISNSPSSKSYTYTISSASIHVAQTPLIAASNYSTLNLSFKYKVAGEIDDDDTYDFGTVETSLSADRDNLAMVPGTAKLVGTYDAQKDVTTTKTGTVNVNLPASLNGQSFYLNFKWENDDDIGSQPPIAIDDIVLLGKGTGVESQLSHTKTINLAASDSNFILSANDREIIAAVSKLSTKLNCLQATVSEAGTAQADVKTSNGTYKRSQKVIKLTLQAATNATYSLTLYYSTAELATWPSLNSLKVMKVADGVSLTSTLTAANAVILTPVVDDRRTTDGYASFTVNATGFSQFFLVEAATLLPLQVITFNASLVNNGASLYWNTSNEQVSKGFNVQRSTDGVNFSTIGFVNATNNLAGSTYGWFDSSMQQSITYYYRLQQTDLDGNNNFSAIRSLKLNGTGVKLAAFPNPARNATHILLGKSVKASAWLATVGGKTVWQMPGQQVTYSGFEVPLQNLPAGVYVLWVQEDQKRSFIKIIKE